MFEYFLEDHGGDNAFDKLCHPEYQNLKKINVTNQ